MTIAELRALQKARDLCDVHLVEIREDGFTLAHTDEEREGIVLRDCELHVWLTELDRAPCRTGVYIALRHEPDAYSESYRADPWDFELLEKESHDQD